MGMVILLLRWITGRVIPGFLLVIAIAVADGYLEYIPLYYGWSILWYTRWNADVPIAFSFLVPVIWTAALFSIGWLLAKRKDFFMCSKGVYPESKRAGLGLLIRYDWRFGLLTSLYKYIPAALIFLLSCASLQASVGYDTAAGILPPVRLTLGDYLLNTFRGIPVYHLVSQNADNAFILPASWLILNLYATFLVGGYPLNDLHGYGQQILTRSGKRTRWWLSKVCWNVTSVFVFYLVGYAVLILYAGVTGSPSLEATASVTDQYFLSGAEAIPTAQWLPYALVLPFLTTAAVCLLQMCLSLFIRPILSYIAVICLMVASSYFCTPLLIGNCSMLARGAFATAEGIPLTVSLFILIGVIALSLLIGGIRFHRYDILNKA